MATQHDETTAPARADHGGVPVGSHDGRPLNSVLGKGIIAFAIFAVLFVLIDLMTGALGNTLSSLIH